MVKEFDDLAVELEALGEREVYIQLAHGVWEGRQERYVLEWINQKSAERAEAAASKRDAREERTSALAARANRIAITALIIAAMASAKEIKWLITSLMAWLR